MVRKHRQMKKILKSKRVFNGRLIRLYLEKQRFPHGVVVDLEVIRHPGAVLVVPFLDKERIILIKQYRPVINSYIWELPAGTLDQGEQPLHCARRELIEETGYRAKSWKRIGNIFPAPGYTTEKILIFTARRLEQVESEKEPDELIVTRIFKRRQVRQLLRSGKIVDAKTICALQLAHIL